MTTGSRPCWRAASAKASAALASSDGGRQPVGLLAKIWMESQPISRAMAAALLGFALSGMWRPRRIIALLRLPARPRFVAARWTTEMTRITGIARMLAGRYRAIDPAASGQIAARTRQWWRRARADRRSAPARPRRPARAARD